MKKVLIAFLVCIPLASFADIKLYGIAGLSLTHDNSGKNSIKENDDSNRFGLYAHNQCAFIQAETGFNKDFSFTPHTLFDRLFVIGFKKDDFKLTIGRQYEYAFKTQFIADPFNGGAGIISMSDFFWSKDRFNGISIQKGFLSLNFEPSSREIGLLINKEFNHVMLSATARTNNEKEQEIAATLLYKNNTHQFSASIDHANNELYLNNAVMLSYKNYTSLTDYLGASFGVDSDQNSKAAIKWEHLVLKKGSFNMYIDLSASLANKNGFTYSISSNAKKGVAAEIKITFDKDL